LTGPEEGGGAGEHVTTRMWVIDRVEGMAAVLVADDDRSMVDVLLSHLPARVAEGPVLRVPQPDGEPQAYPIFSGKSASACSGETTSTFPPTQALTSPC